MTGALDMSRPINCWIHKLYADRFDDACRNRVIQLIIYPDPEALRTAANRYARKNHKNEEFTDTLGIFHPAPFQAKYDRRKRQWTDTTPPFAGVMRLAQGHLTPEVIAHESTHAALHITRLHTWNQPGAEPAADFGGHCDDREEAFAYLHGALTAEVLKIAQRVESGTP